MIYCEAVTKSLNNNKILDNVSFKTFSGELMFVTGHSSAEKTTLLRCLGGLCTIDSGNILINEIDISTLSTKEKREFRHHIGWLFPSPRLIDRLTIEQNLAANLAITAPRYTRDTSRIRAALEFVDLYPSRTKLPRQLSTIQQQFVCLARAIVHKPKVIIADDPGQLLTTQARVVFFQQLKRLSRSGIVVIASTETDAPEIALADRLIELSTAQSALSTL